MTALLTLGVLVLVAIAIWQLTKIFELSQIKKDDSQIANDNDNKYNGYLMFAFLVFIYGITIFSFYKDLGMYMVQRLKLLTFTEKSYLMK